MTITVDSGGVVSGTGPARQVYDYLAAELFTGATTVSQKQGLATTANGVEAGMTSYYGGYRWHGASVLTSPNTTATTISSNSIWYKGAGTTSSLALSGFTHSNNRLTATSVISAGSKALVRASATLLATTANEEVGISIFSSVSGAAGVRSTATTVLNGAVHLSVTDVVDIADTEYVELHIRNYTTATNLTVRFGQVWIEVL